MISPKKKIRIIINPVSGTTSKKNIPSLATELLNPEKFELSFVFTEYAGHGYKLSCEAVEDKIDYVIAVGGDGTVNEIARALVHTDSVLGIIPLGSGNGLGRDLGMSTQIKKAIQVIEEENIITIDYGKANGHLFFCTCGVGFDATIAECAKGKNKRGLLMYFRNIVEAFFQQKPQDYEIICPEGTIKDKAFVVTCANASQYGYNAHIAPHANVQDGKMNLMIMKPLSLIDVPQASLQLFTRKLDKNKKMLEFITNKVTIQSGSRGLMHVDGDPVRTDDIIHVEIIPLGLKVLVPAKASRKRPFNTEELVESVLTGTTK